MKSPSGFIGIGTHDLPACIAMPQRNAPPRTPMIIQTISIFLLA